MLIDFLKTHWPWLGIRRCARPIPGHRHTVAEIESLESRWLPSAVCDLKPSLVNGPESAAPGSRISIQTAVDNLGTSAASKFQVQYRLSLDAVIDDQDPLLATVTRKRISGEGTVQWSQTVTLPSDLPAGTYHISVIVDPANTIPEGNETNNSLADAGTITVASATLSGQVQYLKARRPVDLHVLGNSTASIDPTETTWIVIHGRNESSTSPNLVQLATQIDAYQPGDQVLLLDWRKAAKSGSIGGQGENYIRPVATWAAEALTAYGFSGQQLNLVGYSWGAEVAAEMAEVIGQVNAIMAIDPARDYPGGSYNPEAPGEVDFEAHADQSWAFFASSSLPFGSAINASTAEDAFVVTGSDHFGIVSLVTNLISLADQNAVGSDFPLTQLLTGIPVSTWVGSSYSSLGVLNVGTGTFDAVLIATPNGMAVQSLRFFDGSTEQSVSVQ
jgi:pimeloyl-ACP methyl ester carboxylesterase